jgi:uncharacterized protein (TIGR02996 family)
MSDRQAFLDAIIAELDNDTVRLVYADWLEEHGEPERAEFIRVQCELAEMLNDEEDWSKCTGVAASWCPNCGDCCCKNREDSMSDAECPLHSAKSKHSRLKDLQQREHDLFEDRGYSWCDGLLGEEWKLYGEGKESTTARVRFTTGDPFVGSVITDVFELPFRRGLIGTVSLTLQQAIDHPEIFRSNPIRPRAGMVTDKRPVESTAIPGYYRFFSNPPEEGAGCIGEIFECLPPSESQPTADGDGSPPINPQWYFATEQEAMIALATALIANARSQPATPAA